MTEEEDVRSAVAEVLAQPEAKVVLAQHASSLGHESHKAHTRGLLGVASGSDTGSDSDDSLVCSCMLQSTSLQSAFLYLTSLHLSSLLAFSPWAACLCW